MPHPHLKLMKEFLKDAEKFDDPGKFWQWAHTEKGPWYDIREGGTPDWIPYLHYRRKPEYIIIAGYKVPKPVEEPLEDGQGYWVADPDDTSLVWYARWKGAGSLSDQRWLARRRIHLTKSAAQEYARFEIRLAGGTIPEEEQES